VGEAVGLVVGEAVGAAVGKRYCVVAVDFTPAWEPTVTVHMCPAPPPQEASAALVHSIPVCATVTAQLAATSVEASFVYVAVTTLVASMEPKLVPEIATFSPPSMRS
jgi:hypothetical protein